MNKLIWTKIYATTMNILMPKKNYWLLIGTNKIILISSLIKKKGKIEVTKNILSTNNRCKKFWQTTSSTTGEKLYNKQREDTSITWTKM